MSRDHVSTLRCLAVWLAAGGTTLGCSAWLLPGLLAGPGGGFDEVLVWGCGATLVGCAGWLWLVTSVVALDVLRGRPDERRAGIPLSVRRFVLGACGVAIVGSAVAAPSYAGEHRPPSRSTHLLVGLPLPDRATALTEVAGAVHRARQDTATSQPDRVAVRGGDTLWGLAERTLPPGADRDAVADRWREIYALNRDVIGDDPDLIRPGQLLTLPDLEEDS